jgi:hypothetical protein
MHTVTLTCANLMLSWLMQQLIDLATGANTGYSLTQLAITFCMFPVASGARFCVYLSRHSQISLPTPLELTKTWCFPRSQKEYRRVFKENTAFYVFLR